VITAFGRHEAPVVTLPQGVLGPHEVIFLMTGLIPNRKGHPLIHRWFGMQFQQGDFETVLDLHDVLQRTGLGRTPIPNPNRNIDTESLAQLLPRAVREATTWMSANRDEFNAIMQPKLQHHLDELNSLKSRRLEQVQRDFGDLTPTARLQLSRREAEQRRVEALFTEYQTWIKETITTEDRPYVRIVAVLRGDA
jgi:hypothetical protein